jgi:hypothetical protein
MLYAKNEVYATLRSIELSAAKAPEHLRDRIFKFLKEIDQDVMVLAWESDSIYSYVSEYLGYALKVRKLAFWTGDLYDYHISVPDTGEVIKSGTAYTLKKAEEEIIRYIEIKKHILVV